MPPIPGIAPKTACTTADTMLKRNHAQPKMIDCIAHGLHTQTWKCFVKQSSGPLHFRFHLPTKTTSVILFPIRPMTRSLLVEVRASPHQYHVLIESGLLASVGDVVKKQLGGLHCAVISDTNVAPLFGDRVKRSLTAAGFQPELITIPAGEKSKTLEQSGAICDQMIAAGLDRQSFLIGLGGGVIGDISGFVAAIYHRGIPHVQIPTTLLAMVDSSIGGKTGVNTSAGKNLIGAIHPPALVIDDVDVLKTLPRREFNQGFAEIIKHAIIADAEMFETVAQLPKL